MKRQFSIPKCHDHTLVKEGCKHSVGSGEIEKENLLSAISAALEAVADGSIPEMEEHILVCFRAKDEAGWHLGICITPLNGFKPGDEIILNTTNIKKLIVK